MELHPDMRRIVDGAAAMPRNASPEEERAAWIKFCSVFLRPRPKDMRVKDLAIPGPAGEVPIRIYWPAGNGPRPCFVYIHGGGWVSGDLDTNDTIAWGFAQETGAVVASVHYRLAPEHPYPAAFDDCYTAVEYLVSNAQTHGVEGARIAVGGDSAGGNLAAAICLAARDRKGPRISAQVLIYPVLTADQGLPSRLEHSQAPLLRSDDMDYFYDAYLGDSRSDPDTYAIPAVAADLSGLPPALIHTADIDPLRDDGKVYAKLLIDAGNDVRHRCAPGMIHSFMRARFEGPGAAAEYEVICGFLREHLRLV